MRMLSWTLALAASCFLAGFAPASAATVTYTGTDVAYDITDLGGEYDGFAEGEVTDGIDTFDFFASAFVNLIDPPDGTLLITELGGGDVILDGLLESIDVGVDYIALIYGDLQGSAATSYGGKARVVFTGVTLGTTSRVASFSSQPSVNGVASVTIAPIPLPATALLLLSGVAGIMVTKRKRSAA